MEKLIIDDNVVIYVGKPLNTTHNCEIKKEQYIPYRVYFKLKGRIQKELPLTVIQCPKCKNIYLSEKTYKKHWFEFKRYYFIHTKTGKPPKQMLRVNSKPPEKNFNIKIDKKELKTPQYIVNGLKHPFQGGGCSGK